MVAIVETLFDALSYFEREPPTLSTLHALFVADATIRTDGRVWSPPVWLEQLARVAMRRGRLPECSFFVVRRTIVRAQQISVLVEHQRIVSSAVREKDILAATLLLRGDRISFLDLSHEP